MSCRAVGPSPTSAPVSAEQYNTLYTRLDNEMRLRARVEAELASAREEIVLLQRRLNSSSHPQMVAPPSTAAESQATPTVDTRKEEETKDKEILSHCSDISGCKSGRTPEPAKKKSKATSSLSNSNGITKKKTKKERTTKVKIPGQSRYWTPEEHKLFLEALNKFGHKDLRNISAYVGTRNMTQVRTHSQKYFMRLMREAKRQNPMNVKTEDKEEQTSTAPAPNAASSATSEPTEAPTPAPAPTVEAPKETTDGGDKYSVPNTCGMTLLCLVGQDTLPV